MTAFGISLRGKYRGTGHDLSDAATDMVGNTLFNW